MKQREDKTPLIWEGKPTWSSYIYIWMFSSIIGIRGIISLWLGHWESALFQGILIILVSTVAFFFHQTTHFKMTRYAVYRSKGFSGKSYQSFPISAISSVSKQQGPLERLFGIGNIVLHLKDGQKERISGIYDPDILGRKIRAMI